MRFSFAPYLLVSMQLQRHTIRSKSHRSAEIGIAKVHVVASITVQGDQSFGSRLCFEKCFSWLAALLLVVSQLRTPSPPREKGLHRGDVRRPGSCAPTGIEVPLRIASIPKRLNLLRFERADAQRYLWACSSSYRSCFRTTLGVAPPVR